MLNYRLSFAERETTFVHCRADSDATIYTSDRARMAKLDKLCAKFPGVYQCVWTDTQILGDGLPMGKRYSVPSKLIRFGKPASEAQKAAGREKAAKMNSARQF